MLCGYVLLLLSASYLRPAASCDEHCMDTPSFNPPRLIMRHGDPTSATCTLCPSCIAIVFDLEKSLGRHTKNETTILWTVDKMTEWSTSPLCFYTNASDYQCCSRLPVTVYKPPDSVSISFKDHSGPVMEDHQYTLQCEVGNVAPLRFLAVTFYRGQTALGQRQHALSRGNKPVTEVFTLNINTSKEDDGAQYWCQAKLDLGPEGPQPPPVLTSTIINTTVHYKPQLQGPPPPDTITVTQGDSVTLSCEASANPSPRYTWRTLPASLPPSHSSKITIPSVGSEHGGKYVCSVNNSMGALNVTFNVVVKANVIPYIAIAVAVVILTVVIGVIYCYKQNRRGHYNLKDVLRRRQRHVAVPNVE